MSLFGPPNVEKLKAKGDIEGLVKTLSYEKDWKIRQAGAEALISIGESAVDPVIWVLEHEQGAGHLAAFILGEIGDKRGISKLCLALNSQSPYIRGYAAEALGKIYVRTYKQSIDWEYVTSDIGKRGKTMVIDALCTAFKQADSVVVATNPDVFQPLEKIEEALVKIGGDVVEPLCSILKEAGLNSWTITKEAEVFNRTGVLLAKIGEPAVEQLCNILRDDSLGNLIVDKVVKILVSIGLPSVDSLSNLLMDDDSRVGCLAAGVLGEIGSEGVVDQLLGALRSEYESVRYEASRALIGIYESGKLSDALKGRILSEKNNISYERHVDNDNNDCFPHDDYYETVNFPE